MSGGTAVTTAGGEGLTSTFACAAATGAELRSGVLDGVEADVAEDDHQGGDELEHGCCPSFGLADTQMRFGTAWGLITSVC